MMIVKRDEIISHLELSKLINAVERSFVDYSKGKAEIPPVTNLWIKEHNGELHIKSGYIHGSKIFVIKIATGFYDNPKKGLSSSGGMVIAFDSTTGLPLALFQDKGYITDIRTAAAGAVAVKFLAKRLINTVGVVGTGIQARKQIEAALKVRRFRTLKVYGRMPQHLDEYVNEIRNKFALNVMGFSDPQKAVDGSDIVITATPSEKPIIRPEWLQPGMLVVAVGADAPEKQELFPECFRKADKIVVDSVSQNFVLGDLFHALKTGVIDKQDIHAEIGEIVNGTKTGRESDKELIIAKLTGVAVQDIAAVSLILDKIQNLKE